MARANPIQNGLNRLAAIQDDPSSPEGGKALRDALAKGLGLVVEKAAKLVAQVACGPEPGDDRGEPVRVFP